MQELASLFVAVINNLKRIWAYCHFRTKFVSREIDRRFYPGFVRCRLHNSRNTVVIKCEHRSSPSPFSLFILNGVNCACRQCDNPWPRTPLKTNIQKAIQAKSTINRLNTFCKSGFISFRFADITANDYFYGEEIRMKHKANNIRALSFFMSFSGLTFE